MVGFGPDPHLQQSIVLDDKIEKLKIAIKAAKEAINGNQVSENLKQQIEQQTKEAISVLKNNNNSGKKEYYISREAVEIMVKTGCTDSAANPFHHDLPYEGFDGLSTGMARYNMMIKKPEQQIPNQLQPSQQISKQEKQKREEEEKKKALQPKKQPEKEDWRWGQINNLAQKYKQQKTQQLIQVKQPDQPSQQQLKSSRQKQGKPPPKFQN